MIQKGITESLRLKRNLEVAGRVPMHCNAPQVNIIVQDSVGLIRFLLNLDVLSRNSDLELKRSH